MVGIEDRGRVRVLRLQRPERRNALSRALIAALRDAWSRADADPEVRAVVLAGEGPAFCAGLDLGELEELPHAGGARHRQDAEALASLYRELFEGGTPVVAAVEGPAVGGGAGLSGACDAVVASRAASIAYPEVRLGFVAALVAVLLVGQVGLGRARELLTSGRRVAAEEALRLGLVHELVDEGEAVPRALERAEGLARQAPGAMALTKSLLAGLPGRSLDDAWAFATEANAAARDRDELREGVAAFLEGREPPWRRG